MAERPESGHDDVVIVRERPQRPRLSQADMPLFPLLELAPIPEALLRLKASRPISPAELAQEVGESPTSNSFRSSTAASAAYGLTDAGAQADAIGLTDLGRRLTLPASAEEAHDAAVEALTRPRLLRELLLRYDGRPWPPDTQLRKRLIEAHWPGQQIQRAVAVINANVRDYHLLERPGGTAPFLNLKFRGASADSSTPARELSSSVITWTRTPAGLSDEASVDARTEERPTADPQRVFRSRERVFLSVPLESPLTGQLTEVLAFGGYLPVLPTEETATGISVRALEQMRGCTAVVVDLRPHRHRPSEPDDESLMRAGAAVALYGERTVLLCPPYVSMPAALERLPHLHYSGESLDYDSTMALVRAFNRMRGNW